MIRAHFLAFLLAGAAVLLGGVPSAIAQAVVWERVVNGLVAGSVYPGSNDGFPGPTRNAVAVDGAGDVFAVGNVQGDCRIVKYSGASGAVLWAQSSRSGYPYADRRWCAIAVDASDNAFLGSMNGNEFAAVKYSGASGQVLWESTTASGPPIPPNENFTFGMLSSIAVDASGDVVATGSRGAAGSGVAYLRIVKFAGSNGSIRWEDVDITATGVGAFVLTDPDGSVIVTGARQGALVTVKHAANGTRIWRNVVSVPGTSGTLMAALDATGNVFVTGTGITKYAAADGALLWSKPFGIAGDVARSISVDASGNAFVAGTQAFDFVAGQRYKATKYAASDGAVLWDKDFAKPGNFSHDAYASIADASGNLVVTGLSGNFTGTGLDGVTVKFAGSDGTVLWDRTINAVARDDAMSAIALDAAGNILVAGYSVFLTISPHRDLQVVKYTPVGTELWHIGPSNLLVPSATWTQGLAVDPAGNVLVAGYYWGPNVMAVFDDNEDVVVAKLSGATGTPLMGLAYTGPWPDAPHGVAADANGDIIYTGTATQDGNGNAVLRTVKHSGSTGQLLWQAIGAAPGYKWGHGSAFTLDGGGNVIATANNFTQKYSGANGGVMWTAPYGGYRIAMTAGGDFVISSGGQLVKLAGANGALLWSKTATGNEYYSDFVLDGAGNVIALGWAGLKILKLAPNGTVIFERDLPPEAGYEQGTATNVAVDAAGDIFFSQSLANYPANPVTWIARTFKVSGANGDVLWSRARPPAPAITLQRIAVDAAGHPFVVGFDSGKLRMLRYSGATGAPLWDSQYATVDGRPGIPRDVVISGDAVYIAGELDSMNTDSIFVLKVELSADITPEAFSFAAQTGVELLMMQTSQAIMPAGFNRPIPIAVSNGEYSLGCTGSFQSAPGMIQPGQAVCVRHVSAGTTLSLVTTLLTLGGVSSTFTTMTASVDDVFTNPRRFAMQQYRDFLGREGEPDGVAFYQALLSNGALTRSQVVEAFLASPEFQAGLPQCTRLYFSFFLRIPDYDGLMFQVGQFRGGVPLELIAQNFFNSPEFTARYGALTDPQYVDLVYQNVLGRSPDDAGREYYLERLGDGRLTRGQMMVGFSESPEFQQLVADEVYITAVYVGLLRRTPDPGGLDFYVDLIEGGLPPNAIITGFIGSPEYRGRFTP